LALCNSRQNISAKFSAVSVYQLGLKCEITGCCTEKDFAAEKMLMMSYMEQEELDDKEI
jgi:hypothetical protein